MELIEIKEEQIKIKRTIFNMDPKIEKTTKIARNLDSGTTQLQQISTLLHTLLRLEAIRASAYERWQPYFNQTHADFLGLVALLNVFHGDNNFVKRLQQYFQSRQKLVIKLKKDKSNPKLVEKYQSTKDLGAELMEELREKIYSLQLTAEEFQTMVVN